MKMLKKILSLILVFTILIPTFNVICEKSFLTGYAIDIQSFDECVKDAEYEENYINLYEAIHSCAGDWYTATKKDMLSYNFFHNAVQDHIILLSGGKYKKEKRIDYKAPVYNPVTQKMTNYGSVDLYTDAYVKDGIEYKYIWEVKPASYLGLDRRPLAEEQLSNYTNTLLHKDKKTQYLNGGLDPLVGVGIFTVPISPKVSYEIKYSCTISGIIVYWFERIIKKDDDEEDQQENVNSQSGDNSDSNSNTNYGSNVQGQQMQQSLPDYNVFVFPWINGGGNSGTGSGGIGIPVIEVAPPIYNGGESGSDVVSGGGNSSGGESGNNTGGENGNEGGESGGENGSDGNGITHTPGGKYGEPRVKNPAAAEAIEDASIIFVSASALVLIKEMATNSAFAEAIMAKFTSLKEKLVIDGTIASIITAILLRAPQTTVHASDGNNTDSSNIAVPVYQAEYDMLNDLFTVIMMGTAELSDYEVTEDIEDLKKDIEKQYEDYTKSEKQKQIDPLIIKFSDTEKIEFTSLEEGVNFDLDNNEFKEKTPWIKNIEGFLTIDINGNGTVDNGGELFGDRFVMKDGTKASSGIEAIKSLDTNKNNKIDSADALFLSIDKNDNVLEKQTLLDQIKVWFDNNLNGETDIGDEIISLKELNVDYIDLDFKYDTKNSEVPNNDEIKPYREEEFSNMIFKTGDSRRISEIWFSVNTVNTTHDGKITIGNVPTFKQALEKDTTGDLEYYHYMFENATNVGLKRYYLKKILYIITDSININPQSRGGNIDARDLHVIEQFMGHQFNGVNGTSPNATAAEMLKIIYKSIEDSYYNYINLISSSGIFKYMTFVEEDENGAKYVDTHYVESLIDSNLNNVASMDVAIYDYGKYIKDLDIRNKTNAFEKYKNKYGNISQHYDEIISLIDNTITLVGSENNDELYGTNYNDIIIGEEGNDKLIGKSGNDYIYGSYGDDIMNGDAGDDSYYFGMYHGNDVVNDTEGDNKIIFIDGLSVDDYTTSVSSNGKFILTNKYTGDTITLNDFIAHPFNYDFFSYNGSQTVGGGDSREVVEGSDADDYLDASDGFNIFYAGEGNDTIAGGNNIDFMYGGNGNDTLLGRNGTNIIYGEGGNDTIYDGDHSSYLNGGDNDDVIFGGGGDDILDGGAGNDILQGDHGNDTFIYGIGYDIDTLKDAAGEPNTIIIHGYHKSDMNNFRDDSNLIIDFGKNTGDRMIIERFFDYAANSDITFIFDDDTLLSRLDIRAKSLPIYGNGSNYLSGTEDDDIIDAGAGDTLICGANGEDTYIFGKGYNHDSIHEWGSDHSFVELKDINSDEITIEMQDGNLNIYVNETEDELTILNFVYGSSTFTYRFADGAEGYIDKNTYEFIFTKQPDPVDEENITDSDISEVEDVFDEETDAAA